MKLIATKHGKSDKYDSLLCIRGDGTQTSVAMPRQGILPHDLIHFVVEDTLAYTGGFLGMVAAGSDIGFAMTQGHDIANAALADQAVHAEAVVESLQAQLWSGAFDPGQFVEGVRGACATRGRPAPELAGVVVEDQLYGAARTLAAKWQEVPPHGRLELEMKHI
ncbi:hypothetical protein [Massilia soli]|uniref:Uncharacterized protein n=1 Tax=Massilia soli TaxID=2792854 RepID=A0ABS7SSI2_9BURK|nr:hypothetical protein [Massilia soli]MBZ2208895.1 hypothetical protein [Massilia soli]